MAAKKKKTRAVKGKIKIGMSMVRCRRIEKMPSGLILVRLLEPFGKKYRKGDLAVADPNNFVAIKN